MKKQLLLPLASLTAVLLTLGALLQSSCEIESGNETVRNLSIRLAGTYTNENGIPTRQSGAPTTRLSLTQSGDQLFAVDEHNLRWSGTVTRAEGTTFASVVLRGSTTAGGDVTLTGDIQIDGTTARFTGIWVEPGYTSNFSAQATVSAQPEPTPTPGPDPTPTPTPTPGNTSGSPSLVITTP